MKIDDDYRLVTVGSRKWFSLLWRAGTRHRPMVKDAMEDLAALPGVTEHTLALDLPETVWDTPEFQRLATALPLPKKYREPPRSTPLDSRVSQSDVQMFDEDNFVRISYPHQVQAAKQALNSGGLLLADQMGLGKSQSALLAAAFYQGQRPDAKVLILGPLFTRSVWIAELRRMQLIHDESEVCVVKGKDTRSGDWFDTKWYFCHYDVVNEWFARFRVDPPAVVIADEAHYLRNARTRRSRGVSILMGSAKVRLLLTGTPIENKPQDLHALLSMVSGKGTWGSLTDFRVRYCGARPGPFRGFQDGAPTKVSELRERMNPYYRRLTVEDAGLPLPGFTRSAVKAQLEGKRRDMYQSRLESSKVSAADLLAAIEHGAQGEALSLLHQLRTITSDAKRGTTVALLDSMWEQQESAVVFVWSRAQAEHLAGMVSARSRVYVVHGGHSVDQRDEAVNDFQRDPGGSTIFATYGALREGVTLHAARHVVFHDLDWSPASIAQAERRVHRIGQTRACMSHWIVAENTIDTLFARALISKTEQADLAIGVDYGFSGLAYALGGGMVVDLQQEIADALEEWRGWERS